MGRGAGDIEGAVMERGVEPLFLMRRRSGGFLTWHEYKTSEAREKWARTYVAKGDCIWMNEDGSSEGLHLLHDDDQWHPPSA